MPKLVYTDDEGNEVESEIEYTPDQIEEFKIKAEQGETKLTELETSIAEKEEELAKLRNKDLNFSKFRERTEEEKKKWEEGLKGDIKGVYEELQSLKTEQQAKKDAEFTAGEKAILRQLAGDDEDLKKSIKNKSQDFVGEARTLEELEGRFRQAFTLIKEERPKPNPLYGVSPAGSFGDPTDTPPDFIKTQRGKETYSALFGHEPLSAEEAKKLEGL
jgi:chromosome segregation ATPase